MANAMYGPWSEELDALSTKGMTQQAGSGKSWELHAAPCYSCFPGPTPDFRSIFLFHLKAICSLLLPLRLNGHLLMSLLCFTSFLTQIYSRPVSVHVLRGWFCPLTEGTLSLSSVQHAAVKPPPCQVKHAKQILDSCSVPSLSFATTADIC